MPYVHITTTAPADAAKKSALLEGVDALLPILPGKNRNNAMVHIDSGAFVAMGDPATPCVFAEIRLYGKSPADAKSKFTASLTELFTRELGVPAHHVYLNYFEMDHWGTNGGLI